MDMSVNWGAVKEKARAVRQQYGISSPPINLFEIAVNEGIDIRYFVPDEKTKSVAGLLNKEKKEVFLNVEDSAPRQNFTLAHELAHYFLDHQPDEYSVYRRDSLYSNAKPEKEQEADCFAAELLMPIELINKVKSTYDLTNVDVQVLSKLFGVSPAAMKYRLKDLSMVKTPKHNKHKSSLKQEREKTFELFRDAVLPSDASHAITETKEGEIDLDFENEMLSLQNRREKRKSRRRWNRLLTYLVISGFTLSYVMIILIGFGVMNFNDNAFAVPSVVAAGVIQTYGLAKLAIKYFFSEDGDEIDKQ